MIEPEDRSWPQRIVHGLVYRLRYHRWRFDPRRYLANIGRASIDRPVFLLGTQGGGLTLVSRVLRRHPRTFSVTGNPDYWTGSAEMQNVLADALPDDLRLEGHPSLSGREDSWLYATDQLLPDFRRSEEDATDRLSDILLARLRMLLVLNCDGDEGRFVDQSQSYTVKASFLRRLLKGRDPRFVLVTRNPYALCLRAVDRVLDGTGLSRSERLELAVQHWDNSMRCALADGEAIEGFGTVRFEDFLAEPERTLEVIDEVVELGLEPDLLPASDDRMPLGTPPDGKWYPLRPDVNAKYLRGISEQVVAAVDERCGNLAEQLGYTPDGP